MKSIRKFTNNSKYFIIFFSIITNTNCAIVSATQSDFSKLEDTGKEEYKLIQIGRNAEAIKSLEKKIFNDKKNPYLYYLLGRAYGNLKQFEIGERYFKKSLRSSPYYPKVYLGYALMKGRKGELKEAVKLLDKAIEIDPKYAKAYSNRGVAKGALSDNVGAIDDFNKAILIDPLLADAYRNRGITNELIGNIKGACKDWKTASSLGQNQTKEWFSTQCKNIKEIKEEDNQKLVSSLIESNQRLSLELESLKNNSSKLGKFSIGTLSENKNNQNLSKNKNSFIGLFYFFSGGLLSLIISRLITTYAKNKKDISSKSLNKKDENIKNNFSHEFQDLNKLISKKTEILNNLFLEKEVIENHIESLKYDLNYYEIQKSNLKVYTLSKYKELFSNKLENIETFEFNGLSSINLIDKNKEFYNYRINPIDVNSYKFLKNS